MVRTGRGLTMISRPTTSLSVVRMCDDYLADVLPFLKVAVCLGDIGEGENSIHCWL